MPNFDYDVFLSHNRADTDWARALAVRLERETWHGRTLKVFLDEWDFQPGELILVAREKALTASRKIALVMSPEYFASEWAEFDRALAAFVSPANRAQRVVPLLLRDCEMPPFLEAINWIDFRDETKFDAAFRRLLAFLREEPVARGDAGDHADLALRRQSKIPAAPAIGFVARHDQAGRDLVVHVGALLARDHAFVALVGEGGIGKTTLAAEIARATCLPAAARGGAVLWVSADARPGFSLGTLLDEVVTQCDRADLRPLALANKIERVRELLATPGDHAGAMGDHAGAMGDHIGSPLLVLDNFETIAEAEQKPIVEFLADAPCAAFVTSRTMIAHRRAHNVELNAMGDAEAREFIGKLIALSPRRHAFAGLDVSSIITTACANPLVMEWIVAQIAEAREPRRVFDELARGQGDAAQRVFDRSFHLLDDAARAALLALTLFAPNATRAALAEVAGLDADACAAAITRLVTLRLAETTALNARVGIVGLTRTLARAHTPALGRETEGGWVCATRFVAYFVRYARAHRETTPEDLDALEAERANLLAAMDTAFAAQDWQSVMRIADALGIVNGFLDLHGYWEEAIACGEQAAEAARRAGDESAEARFTGNAATILKDRGEYDKARAIYERVLETCKRLGEESNVAVLLHNLGMIAQDQGDYAAARTQYAESLEIKKRLGDQSGIARSLHQLGMIAQDQGDYAAARTQYAESLEIKKRLGDQRGIASSLHNLGNIAYQQGDYATARTQYGECLETFKRLGNQSGIASLLGQLGILAQAQGDYATARTQYAESLEIEKRLGDQRGIAITLHQLGNIAYQQGDYATARTQYAESLEIAKRLGDQSGIASSLHGLGRLAEIAGDKAEAARLFREALDIFERLKSPDVAIARKSLARVSRAGGWRARLRGWLQRTRTD